MITVTILRNGQPIITRSAVNKRTTKHTAEGEFCEYFLDDGGRIVHNREAGAVALAIKMLQRVKEPR